MIMSFDEANNRRVFARLSVGNWLYFGIGKRLCGLFWIWSIHPSTSRRNGFSEVSIVGCLLGGGVWEKSRRPKGCCVVVSLW